MAEPCGDPRLEIDEHDMGDGRQVEFLCRGDRDPDELDEFGIGPDDSLDAIGDRARIRGEEARIEASWPARRRNGAGNEMQLIEARLNTRFGERRPAAGGKPGRRRHLRAEQKSGLLEGLPDCRDGEDARSNAARTPKPRGSLG